MRIEFHYYITCLNITTNSKNANIVLSAAGFIHKHIGNKVRFLEAAVNMLRNLAKYVIPKSSPKEFRAQETTLKDDPDHCIGGRDSTNAHETRRVSRYRKLSRCYVIQPNQQATETFIKHDEICGHAWDEGCSYTSDNNTDWMTVDDFKSLIDSITYDYTIEKSQ